MKRLTLNKTIRYVLIFITATLIGCASLPFAERQENATTEVSEKWSRDQKERLSAVFDAAQTSERGASVEWSVDSSEQGNGDQSMFADVADTIPGGIKLIYIGVGILLVLFAVKRVASSSAAVKTTLRAADDAIARQIRKLEGRLQAQSTDQGKADLLSQLRDLENERGRLKK